jgi:hypothetical protein
MKFGAQTVYAAYQALAEFSPEKSPIGIARMVGEALYVPSGVHPHANWIEVEFTLTSREEPFKTRMLASGEAHAREVIEQRSGPIMSWQTRPCDPPELPKRVTVGNSAGAITTQAMRLTKTIGDR